MNVRILELVQNRNDFREDDLKIIDEEIRSRPYLQVARALYLYGVHKFRTEDYRREISVTAAYTTDKKNLYQLINGTRNYEKLQTFPEELPHFDETNQNISLNSTEDVENFSNGKVTDDSNKDEVAKVQEDAGLSFHSVDDFLPSVNLSPPKKVEGMVAIKKENTHKYQDEMSRLIAEVEEKMRLSKKTRTYEDENQENFDLDFAETHETLEGSAEALGERNKNPENNWKPMDFGNNLPDNTPDEVSEGQAPRKEPDVSVGDNSNVPQFINTWQSWLKLDKTSENSIPGLQIFSDTRKRVQSRAIDAFIENNPRISKLPRDTTAEYKRSDADISHLMTETLANLYTTQKRYTKALEAYSVLRTKYPEKSKEYQERIKEIKKMM